MADFKVLPQVLIALAGGTKSLSNRAINKTLIFVANGGSFLFGITLGWSAPTGPQILSPDNTFPMTTNEFSWAVAMTPLGSALSCVLSGIIRSRYGTRFTIVIFGLPNLLGWLFIIYGTSPLMVIIKICFQGQQKKIISFLFQLIFGRLLVGVAGGAYCFNIPVYIGEMASKEIRGFLLTLFQVSVLLGVVAVYVLGSLFSLFNLNIICCSMVMIYTTYFVFLPESPAFLLRQEKSEKAEKSIKLLRGSKYDAKSEITEFQLMLEETSKAPKNSFSAEFKKRETFKAFTVVIVLFFFFQMSGINAVLFYTTTIFIETGIKVNPSAATIVLGVAQVTAALAAAGFIDRSGRVLLLIISFVMMIVGLIGIGTFFCLKDQQYENMESIGWLPLPSLCIFVISFSSGLGSIPFVLVGELFSNDAKRIIAPFAQSMNFVMAFVIGLTFPTLVGVIGAGFTFFMFAGFCVLGLLFTIFFVPETKGKSLVEIQTMLRN